AEPGHRQPVEPGAEADADAQRDDASRDLGRPRGREAGKDARDDASPAVGYAKAGHASERGQGQSLTARDDNVLAQPERAAGHSDHDQRLEDAIVRTRQLVAEDDCDPQDELDLLLQGVEGLARHRADRQRGAQGRHDRRGATDRARRRNPAARGTNQPQRELMVGVARVGSSQVFDPAPDRRLAAFNRVIESAKESANLRREPLQVHGGEAYLTVSGATESQKGPVNLNTELRLSRKRG